MNCDQIESDASVVRKHDKLALPLEPPTETIEGRTSTPGFRSDAMALDASAVRDRLVFENSRASAEFTLQIIRERTGADLDAARSPGRRLSRLPPHASNLIQVTKTLLADHRVRVEERAA